MTLDSSWGRGYYRTAAYDLEERRKTLEKKREKERKPKSILIFQVNFKSLRHFLGCNFHSRIMY